MEMTLEALIEAPPTLVFAIVSDVPRWPERMPRIVRVEMLTGGPVTAGTRFRETRRMLGREATEEMTVAEIVPPVLFVLTAQNHGTQYRVTHRIAPEGKATRMTMVFEGRPQTVLARLLYPLGRLLAGSVRTEIEGDLADLKRAIEGTA